MDEVDLAFQLFDDYNRQDPKRIVWHGNSYPEEYFFALQLHDWVKKLSPQASEPLLLASRSQHIGRWKVPRDSFPAGKAGYYKWRTDLAIFHADTSSELLAKAGFEPPVIDRVKSIIRKENLRTDDDVQTIENGLCLVFLQFQFDDFIKKHDDEKLVRIVQKTWRKMNEQGQAAALTLNFDGRAQDLINKALGAKS